MTVWILRLSLLSLAALLYLRAAGDEPAKS